MDPMRVAAGAVTGFVVGMTGVGGGALMTPILLLVFGTAPLTAVGTDLWFAAITKIAVSGLHVRQGLIDWLVVRRLWTGSLPASILTVVWMARQPMDEASVGFVKIAIAMAVCITSLSLIVSRSVSPPRAAGARLAPRADGTAPWQGGLTVAAGIALGALVTLTSVGAGALGAVFLYHLYPTRLTPSRLVATDIAHAIPLALCAGIGHLAISQVDGGLLRDLLVGSVPAALAGAAIGSRVPQFLLRVSLGVVLLAVGLLMLRQAM
jgi:uncharacterized membrane protein YfcA